MRYLRPALYRVNLKQENTQDRDRYLLKTLLQGNYNQIVVQSRTTEKRTMPGSIDEIFDLERFTPILRLQEGEL